MKTLLRIAILLFITGLVIVLIGIPSNRLATAQGPGELGGPLPRAVFRATHTDTPFRGSPPPRLPDRAPTAAITVNYLPAGSIDYFSNLCSSWPTNARTAMDYAANIWAQRLVSTVTIKVEACWTNLGSGYLGWAASAASFRDFAGAPITGTWYPIALANALAGTDKAPSNPDIYSAFNSTGVNWYYGTNGSPAFSQWDFASVALHEIAHGLGFSGSMAVGGDCSRPATYACWGLQSGSDPTFYPIIYDRFTENSSGQSLINTALFANPSAALKNQLTSGNVFFNGTNAKAANGGNRPELYAPSTWSTGSSYSHLDEIYNGGANSLMTFELPNGEANHEPGSITLGILKDLGWTQSISATNWLYLPLTTR